MKIAETYFGGRSEVKKKIVQAIEGSRQKRGMTPEQLDACCGFGRRELPLSIELVKQPDLLTGRAFSRAALMLGLKLDSILPITLNSDQISELVTAMDQEGARVTAACGGGDVSKIPKEKQVPVFLYLKLVQELDVAA